MARRPPYEFLFDALLGVNSSAKAMFGHHAVSVEVGDPARGPYTGGE